MNDQAAARRVAETAAYLRIEGVSKRFGADAAVDDVTLDIRRAEIFCLLGASGCGKTTLLRLIAGFETPDAGRIFIDGQDMARVPPYERPVNMMFQSYALFPHMTVAQNVAFGLRQERLPRAEIDARAAEMLALVKLEELAKRKPDELSGGQRQRVALARALVKRPKLLLLDEPLGSLDKQLREHTQFELMKIQERLGVTFVVVTHDQEEAMTLATRIGVMNRGRIVQVGTPREIYEVPRTRFTAEFIGSVNLFEGRVAGRDAALAFEHGVSGDHALIESAELDAPLLAARDVCAARGSIAWAAVRPESMTLSCATSESGGTGETLDVQDRHGLRPEARANRARGVIRERAYRGGLSVYLVELESGKTVRIMQPNGPRGFERSLAPGERVSVAWHASSVVVVTE
jgi:putrescine transport system ATP-binding protein